MVQFNLLPDVKLEYIKAQRTKRLVMLASLAATALAVFVFILLFMVVNVFQKQHLGNLNTDIEQKTKELKDIPDLEKVLTIQNQLKALPGLHQSKPGASRIYTYLIQITPKDIKISDASFDFDQTQITIDGTTNSLESINRFVDIIKFTQYAEVTRNPDGSVVQPVTPVDKAFSEVVLTNFGVSGSSDGSDGGANQYSVQFKYNAVIFDNTKDVELVVPNIISTRSVTEKPTDLFVPKPQPNSQ